jgi:hypothetical protein
MATADRMLLAPTGQHILVKDSHIYVEARGRAVPLSEDEVTIPTNCYRFVFGKKLGNVFLHRVGEGVCMWRGMTLEEVDIDSFRFTPQGAGFLVTARI